MSGIYIPGMDMPKEGFVEVLIRNDGTVQQTRRGYRLDGSDYYSPYVGEIPATYQAIPVPDHGRLIDADFIVKRLRKQIQDVGANTELANRDREFISIIGAVSTVIPADKEDT